MSYVNISNRYPRKTIPNNKISASKENLVGTMDTFGQKLKPSKPKALKELEGAHEYYVFRQLLERDYSANTKKALHSDLEHFMNWYRVREGVAFTFKQVGQGDIVAYRNGMYDNGYKPATINRKLQSLSIYFKEARKQNESVQDPTRGVKPVSVQKSAPKGLSPEDTRKLCRHVYVLRDKVAVHLMLSAGLRASEAIKLKVSDITISERKGFVQIRNGKGNKYRTVPLCNHLRNLLTEYMNQYKPTDQLLVSKRSREPITQDALRRILQKYTRLAGIEKVTPHRLRHTFGYRYLEENQGDIVGLAQILGHSNINTTAIYTQHREEQLADRVEDMVF